MDELRSKEINVYKVALMEKAKSVGIFLGYCDPSLINEGRVKDEDVSDVQSITIPIGLISDIIKQLMEASIAYQEHTKKIVLNVDTDENGVKLVRF